MTLVVKVKNGIKDWKAPDFVKYFTKRYEEIYGVEYGAVLWAKEGVLFQRIQRDFFVRGKDQKEVVKFIDWAFDMYNSKDREITLTIGYLYKSLEKYLKERGWEKPVIQSIEEEDFDDEMKRWVKEELERKRNESKVS